MPSDSDRLLIQQIRQGDSRAWETLIARYEGRLLAFVKRRLHDTSAVEDIVQETFIGFLNSLPNYDERRDYLRLKVLELLLVKGWANRDVAGFLAISEQQVANYRFAAVKKLTEHIRDAGLPADVFPELQAEPPA